jgi:hypothetical protein
MMRIEAARRVFPRCWFNESTTEAGRDALGYYHERAQMAAPRKKRRRNWPKLRLIGYADYNHQSERGTVRARCGREGQARTGTS